MLTVQGSDLHLKSEATSGHLIELGGGDGQESSWTVRAEHGAFERRVTALAESAASAGDVYDARSPLSSWVGFLIESALENEWTGGRLFSGASRETRARAASAVQKILAREVLRPLDRLVDADTDDGAFEIPLDLPGEAGNPAMAFIATVAFRYVDGVLPRGSWPWSLLREVVFQTGGNAKYAGLEFERLYRSSQTGPLGYLLIARWLAHLKSPDARAFAEEGLRRLTVEHFRQDLQLVLAGESPLRPVVQNIAAALADLEDPDIDALAGELSPEAGDLLRRCVRLARQERGGPGGEAWLAAFDAYWDTVLKGVVERKLQEIATP